MKRTQLNWILAASLIALGTTSYLTTQQNTPVSETIDSLGISAASRVGVQVKTNSAHCDLKRHTTTITEGNLTATHQANLAACQHIASIVNTSVTAVPHASTRLEQYGIDDYATRVLLDDKTITLGSKHPIHAKRYALIRSKIYLLDTDVIKQYEADLTQLLSHRLLPKQPELIKISTPDTVFSRQSHVWTSKPSKDTATEIAEKWSNIIAKEIMLTPPVENQALPGITFQTNNDELLNFQIIRSSKQTIELQKQKSPLTFLITNDNLIPPKL